jgi:hypothetical protein
LQNNNALNYRFFEDWNTPKHFPGFPASGRIRAYVDPESGLLNIIDHAGNPALNVQNTAFPTPAWFNVKAYGAKGDARAVADAITSGSNVVSSATANFTQADVGKTCWGIQDGFAAGIARVPMCTITAVIDSSTVHVSSLGNQPGDTLNFVLGTDDSDAIIAACDAATNAASSFAATTQAGMGTVYLPAGGYIVSKLCINPLQPPGFNVLGDGPRKTVFFPAPGGASGNPGWDFTGSGEGSGMLLNTTNIPGSANLEVGNFSVNGLRATYPSPALPHTMLDVSHVNYVHDIIIENLGVAGGTSAAIGGFGSSGGKQGVWRNLLASACLAGTGTGITVLGGGGTLEFCFATNGYQGLTIQNVNQGTSFADFGDFLAVVGCLVDEGGAVSQCQVVNSSGVTFVGCGIWGNNTAPCMLVDGTSDVSIFGGSIGPFSYRDGASGLQILSGGTVRAAGVRIHKTGVGVGLVNAGTFFDIGGNQIDSISGGGTVLSGMNNTTATSASAGSHGAVPNQVGGYVLANVNGTTVKIPYFPT